MQSHLGFVCFNSESAVRSSVLPTEFVRGFRRIARWSPTSRLRHIRWHLVLIGMSTRWVNTCTDSVRTHITERVEYASVARPTENYYHVNATIFHFYYGQRAMTLPGDLCGDVRSKSGYPSGNPAQAPARSNCLHPCKVTQNATQHLASNTTHPTYNGLSPSPRNSHFTHRSTASRHSTEYHQLRELRSVP